MKEPLNLLIRACITLLPPIMGIIVQVNLKCICKFFGFGGNWYFMHHINDLLFGGFRIRITRGMGGPM